MSAPILQMFVDPARCIGCNACVAACAECDTHRGRPMVHVDKVDDAVSPQTVPTVCMHCLRPTCARCCPADAIKQDEQGVVHSSLRPRCIACRSCELTCPFGVPTIHLDLEQMLKCDLCFDRTSIGKKPMCAAVCPTGALSYGIAEDLAEARPGSHPVRRFVFGDEVVETRHAIMLPRDRSELVVPRQRPTEGPPVTAVASLESFLESLGAGAASGPGGEGEYL